MTTESELPPLPETRAIRAGATWPKTYALAYTADQMREYAHAAVKADRERQHHFEQQPDGTITAVDPADRDVGSSTWRRLNGLEK